MNNAIKVILAVIGIVTFLFLDVPSLFEKYFGTEKVEIVPPKTIINSTPQESNINQHREPFSEPYSASAPRELSTSKESATKQEDYTSYINTSITNSGNTDIAVTIIDDKGNLASSISSSIANIYTKSGNRGTTGLIKSSFFNRAEFQELEEGNADIINKLNLSNYTDYLAIGKINFSMASGKLENGTIICTASISVNIINASNKNIEKSFTISDINGNGVTESQAKEAALHKLLETYNWSYSSL